MTQQRPIMRFDLPLKAVHIQCLDNEGESIKGAFGSGFIRREGRHHFLYTCWHLVTGFNLHDVKVGYQLPNRRQLKVTLQDANFSRPHIQAIGGNQSVVIPLYDTVPNGAANSSPNKPRWYQEKQDVAQFELNLIGIRVPASYDAIKIQLPDNIRVADMQIIEDRHLFLEGLSVGDRVLIVGFPYGYSPLGMEQPTAIVLTRYIAAVQIKGRQNEILLDGGGAAGMSGGPVFVETTNGIFLVGVYTGIIYPDHVVLQKERATALGIYCQLLWTYKVMPLEPY